MVLVANPKRSPGIKHKKRTGTHHKHDERYHKPYWPYLPLLAIVGLGIIANSIWAQHTQSILGDTTGISASQILSDTNVQRSTNHENTLQDNGALTAAAQAKANDMVKRNYWSHNTPDGKTPWTFISAADYPYQVAGENLAYGFTSTSALMNGWMNSTEHRDNILDSDYTQVGFGIAQSPDFQNNGPETIVVAMYAKPTPNTTVVTADVKNPPVSPAIPTEPSAQRVSRLQMVSYKAPFTTFAISAICAVFLLLFIVRHGLLMRRVFVKSEAFIIHHRMLDIFLISCATLGFVLTRTAGFIH